MVRHPAGAAGTARDARGTHHPCYAVGARAATRACRHVEEAFPEIVAP
ncbi:hypothetical protein LMG28688_05406 [Paraburkholderia caffeinitolerans]|uniref:Uncharacterized protein n=1 Tax=Paraburkholderia caffeinitolerans TaxID=1723730 RepID=A0A6J5GLA8_9BURK|nr:hypothetical protein LMG28688_05406 [Paraburkholderia caffeinitolerans]